MDYTTPITTTFDAQRKTLEQSQHAVEQMVEAQQTFGEVFVDSLDSQESPQRRAVEFQQNALHDVLDAVEANMPGAQETFDEARDAVDAQFEAVLDNHTEFFSTLESATQDGVEVTDEMVATALEALDEQLVLVEEIHENLESQTVETIEQVGEQVDDLQSQVEDVQEQMQEASSEALEAIEA